MLVLYSCKTQLLDPIFSLQDFCCVSVAGRMLLSIQHLLFAILDIVQNVPKCDICCLVDVRSAPFLIATKACTLGDCCHRWVLLVLFFWFDEQQCSVISKVPLIFPPCRCFTEGDNSDIPFEYMLQILIYVGIFLRTQIFHSLLMIHSDRPLLTQLVSFNVAGGGRKQMMKNI